MSVKIYDNMKVVLFIRPILFRINRRPKESPRRALYRPHPLRGPERFADRIAFPGYHFKGCLFAYLVLLPVNGPIYSLRLIWSANSSS